MTRWPRPSPAGLLVVRPEDGKILLVRRAPGLSHPGHWGVPGGRAEPGEGPLETAGREAAEELGPLPPLMAVDEHWHAENPFFQFATYLAVLERRHADWEPALNPENDAWGWFDPGALPEPLVPGTPRAVKALRPDRARFPWAAG